MVETREGNEASDSDTTARTLRALARSRTNFLACSASRDPVCLGSYEVHRASISALPIVH